MQGWLQRCNAIQRLGVLRSFVMATPRAVINRSLLPTWLNEFKPRHEHPVELTKSCIHLRLRHRHNDPDTAREVEDPLVDEVVDKLYQVCPRVFKSGDVTEDETALLMKPECWEERLRSRLAVPYLKQFRIVLD